MVFRQRRLSEHSILSGRVKPVIALSPKDRFLEAAISKVAEIGLENLRTRHIAEAVGMSEGSLFAYFNRKEDLLREAFLEVDRRLSQVVLQSPYLREPPETLEDFIEVADEVWLMMYRHLLKNPEETLFLIRYRYSAYYTEEVRLRRKAHNGEFRGVYSVINKWFTETENFYEGFLVNYAFELTLTFAEKVIKGYFENTDETERRIWNAVRSACISLLDIKN